MENGSGRSVGVMENLMGYWRCLKMRRKWRFPCSTATTSSGTIAGRYTMA